MWGSGHNSLGSLMRDYMDCPCCGSRLVVVGQALMTLEEALDDEMDSRIDRDFRTQEQRWGVGEEEPDGA